MSYPPLDQLIPHRAPMRLIEEIVGERDERFVCRGRIPEELATDGAASPILGVEMGAQAAAVLAALERVGDDASPRLGYLVSIRAARFESPEIPAGRSLTVRVRSLGGFHPLANYEIEVSDGASDPFSYLTATIGTFVVS